MASLEGLGFVAIWNDVLSQKVDDFVAWHRQEHMPERLAIPGFVSGTRWRATGTARGYFTLYLLESPAVALSEPYLYRLNNPTPWTLRVMASFRQNSRCVGRFDQSVGALPSERIAVAKYNGSLRGSLADGLANRVTACAGINGCHFGLANAAASALPTTERQGRDVAEPAGMLIVSLAGGADDAAAAEGMRTTLPRVSFDEVTILERELAMP